MSMLKHYKPAGPILDAFIHDRTFLSGIRGPFGSGKSTGAVIKAIEVGMEMPKCLDGVRRSRGAVIRNCYDDKTEILTERRGFQLFRDVLPDDRVATLQDEKLIYVQPDGISISDYDGEMIGFEGEGIDLLVTPDHEMWVSKKRTRAQIYGPYEKQYATDIFGSTSYRIRKDAVWDGIVGYTPDICEFIGYWYAEGSCGTYQGRDRIIITTKNDIEYARSLFARCGIPFTEWQRSDDGINFKLDCPLYIRKLLVGTSSTKEVPYDIKQSPPECAARFIEGMFRGDGHQRKDAVTRVIYTSSKALADGLQELALKAGIAANISSRDRRGQSVVVNESSGVVNHVEYMVTLLSNSKLRPKLIKQVGRYRGWYKQHYTGNVYCAEMEIPTVFVRRNGRAFWCNRTYPELKTTTITTWHQWLPKNSPGKWQEQGPPTHWLKLQNELGEPVDIEVLFLALDSPQDVQKLLSLELTWAWINEAREVPKQVLDGLTGRVGRYPSQSQLPPGVRYWSGIWMDTNPPDTDHWWYVLAEKDGNTEAGQEILESTAIAERELRTRGLLGEDETLTRFYAQPDAMSSQAENLQNLDPAYYVRQMAGKSQDWINVYIRANYGYVRDGKPVVPEYNDSIHCQECEPIFGVPLLFGGDFGLTPACTIGQVDMLGNWRVLDEIATVDMGADRFAELVKRKLTTTWKDFKIERFWGDPAGDIRAGTDERTVFDILKKHGIPAKPTHTNDPIIRREAVASKLTRLDHNGKPSLIVHPRCVALRKALGGAYKYRRLQLGGATMQYADTPDKGPYSHIAEALQYMLLGGGEGKAVVKRSDPRRSPQDYATTDRPDYTGSHPKRQQFARRD